MSVVGIVGGCKRYPGELRYDLVKEMTSRGWYE